MTTIWSIDEL